MIHSLEDKVKLANGTEIPGFGLGVFKVPDDESVSAVHEAIMDGYRLIDTAQIYGNEKGTGEGIRKGLCDAGLKREDVFVTSKIWNNHLSYEASIDAFDESLAKLGLDYLDLYLIHWPGHNAFKEAWKAMESLYKEGKIRAIGVSNFQQHHIETLLSFAEVRPVLNQIEFHPKLAQKELKEFCKQHDIAVQAWSPLMQGLILTNSVIMNLAEKYGRSAAQIVLRWVIQKEVLLVSKSVKPERIKSNAQIFDFRLSEEDMKEIDALNENLRVGPDPDQFDFA